MFGYSNRITLFATAGIAICASITIWSYTKQNKNEKNEEEKGEELSPDETYMLQSKTLFVARLEQGRDDANSNIDNRFYLKEAYEEATKEQNGDLEKEWRKRILMEYTPRGNVIMYYDAYKRGFSYYADTHISYPLLNAVAMKYVCMYQCLDFFIDENVHKDVSDSPFLRIHEIDSVKKKEESKPKTDVKKGPFLQPKPKMSKGKLRIETSQPIMTQNKFVSVGKIRNFTLLEKPVVQKTEIKRVNKPMKYGDFKSWRNPSPDTDQKGEALNSFSGPVSNQ
jgi:hypothetical protein